MPKWTMEQQQAIDTEGENMIVSAGAGSGKTAVLTARVLRELKQGVDIDHLLILTFTKAAASEMKERIRSGIQKDPSLKEQLNKIDQSYITTFDSYAFSIVKKYHYLLGIAPDVSIGEGTVFQLKKQQMIDTLFDARYEAEDPAFLSMISLFCTKDDQEIRNSVLQIAEKLSLRMDEDAYLDTYIDTYFQDAVVEEWIDRYQRILQDDIQEINEALKDLSLEVDGDFIGKMETVLSPLFQSVTYDEIKSHLEIKLPVLRNASEEAKKKKAQISSLVKGLQTSCRFDSKQEMRETIFSTKATVSVLISIIQEYRTLLMDDKRKVNVYEFTDISKMAIQILQEYPEVREEMKTYFHEIMVDEYQDTSDLQETFLSLIENHNIYMVGDIKQSIYRFRNANPYIFKEKYDAYREHRGGVKIDLLKNFRSRKEVLANINLLFDRIMDDEIGGASYQESHRMVFGNLAYEEQGQSNQNFEMEVCHYPYDGKNYSKEEIEAFIVASQMKEKVRKKMQVFDKDEGVLRDCRYSDFAILLDRSSKFDLWKRIFEFLEVPLTIEKEENIAGDEDLSLLRHIVHLVLSIHEGNYDARFAFGMASLLRSYLFQVDDQKVFDILSTRQYQETEVWSYLLPLSKELEHYTAQTLLYDVISTFPFYEKMVEVGNIDQAFYRFEYLLNIAVSLENLGYTVYELDRYLMQLSKEKLELKYNVREEKPDSAKIMTIHKSKGLEFPVCYFAGLSAKFNVADLKQRFVYDSMYGFIVPYFKEGIGEVLQKDLLKKRYMAEEISEKIRLFYVALTRAKEKMIFVLLDVTKEVEEVEELVPRKQRLGYRSFSQILESLWDVLQPFQRKIDLTKVPLSKNYNHLKQVEMPISGDVKGFLIDEVEEDIILSTKKRYSKTIGSLLTKEEEESRTFGIKMHEAMQMMDFQHPDFSHLSGIFLTKVKAFYEQPLIQSLKNAKFYQEFAFIDDYQQQGIIDLMIEDQDTIYCIDYKLKHIDDPLYQEQLHGYQKYLLQKRKKPVKLYLYSILDETLVPIS